MGASSKSIDEIDPEGLKEAMAGFIDMSKSDKGLFTQIRDVTEFVNRVKPKGLLSKAKDLVSGKQKEISKIETSDQPGDWIRLIGNLEAIAFRYAILDDDEPKEALELFLSRMAETPFVGNKFKTRMRFFRFNDDSTSETPWRDNAYNGAYLKVHEGNVFFSYSTGYWRYYDGLEIAVSGKFLPIPMRESWELSPGWGAKKEIENFLSLVEQNGPLPFRACISNFSKMTGLNETESYLAMTNWKGDLFGELKATQLKWATDVFENQQKSQQVFFKAVVNAGPIEELWNVESLSLRLANAWLEGMRKLPLVRSDTITSFMKVEKNTPPFFLREVAAPESAKGLSNDKTWQWNDGNVGIGLMTRNPI